MHTVDIDACAIAIVIDSRMPMMSSLVTYL